MKKQLILFVLMMLPLVASADTVKIGDIYYYLKINEKTAEVRRNLLGYYEGEIVIPSTVVYKSVEYNVTSIGEYAFNFCKDMTSVTIPNSLTNIGKYAFESCI